MLVMIICYFLMGRVLWGSRSIGENTDRQIESMKSKRKVVRMFIAIVSIFAVCWLPYHMFFIYSYHDNKVTSTRYVQHMYLGFYWLAMSNAMVNPIIYYWMNKRFRKYFQQIICCRFFNSQHTNKTPKGIRSSINRKMEYGTDVNVKWKRSTIETQIQAAHLSIKRGSPNNHHDDIHCHHRDSEKNNFVNINSNDYSSPAYICIERKDNVQLKIKYISCEDENNAVVSELE